MPLDNAPLSSNSPSAGEARATPDPHAFRFRLPGPNDRLSVFGRTGTGKSHFAVWSLSRANWPSIPWIVFDTKRDPLIQEIPNLERLKLDSRLPKHPGIYAVSPQPVIDDEATEALLRRIWSKGRTGVFVDEGYSVPDRGGLQSILTQGRSKGIPSIVLVQRPVKVTREILSEAGFFAVFAMNDRRDRKTVQEFLPEVDLETKLPPRHCYYYDVAEDTAFLLKPVPPRQEFMQRFVERYPRHIRRRVI